MECKLLGISNPLSLFSEGLRNKTYLNCFPYEAFKCVTLRGKNFCFAGIY